MSRRHEADRCRYSNDFNESMKTYGGSIWATTVSHTHTHAHTLIERTHSLHRQTISFDCSTNSATAWNGYTVFCVSGRAWELKASGGPYGVRCVCFFSKNFERYRDCHSSRWWWWQQIFLQRILLRCAHSVHIALFSVVFLFKFTRTVCKPTWNVN